MGSKHLCGRHMYQISPARQGFEWRQYRSDRGYQNEFPGWHQAMTAHLDYGRWTFAGLEVQRRDESAERLRLNHAHPFWRKGYICDNQGSASWIWNRMRSTCHRFVCCDHVTEVLKPMYQQERNADQGMEFYVGELNRLYYLPA
eukprot:6456672-Amphidinium_carterae.3